jgi:hypothetical protein
VEGVPEAGTWLQMARSTERGGLEIPGPSEAGGRFNSPGRMPTVYLSEDTHESRQQMLAWAATERCRGEEVAILVYYVRAFKLLNLCDADVRIKIDATLGDLLEPGDLGVARSVGIAAFREGFEGVLYPRPLAIAGRNLGIFLERIYPGQVDLVGSL